MAVGLPINKTSGLVTEANIPKYNDLTTKSQDSRLNDHHEPKLNNTRSQTTPLSIYLFKDESPTIVHNQDKLNPQTTTKSLHDNKIKNDFSNEKPLNVDDNIENDNSVIDIKIFKMPKNNDEEDCQQEDPDTNMFNMENTHYETPTILDKKFVQTELSNNSQKSVENTKITNVVKTVDTASRDFTKNEFCDNWDAFQASSTTYSVPDSNNNYHTNDEIPIFSITNSPFDQFEDCFVPPTSMELQACKSCDRKFNVDRIDVHQSVCMKKKVKLKAKSQLDPNVTSVGSNNTSNSDKTKISAIPQHRNITESSVDQQFDKDSCMNKKETSKESDPKSCTSHQSSPRNENGSSKSNKGSSVYNSAELKQVKKITETGDQNSPKESVLNKTSVKSHRKYSIPQSINTRSVTGSSDAHMLSSTKSAFESSDGKSDNTPRQKITINKSNKRSPDMPKAAQNGRGFSVPLLVHCPLEQRWRVQASELCPHCNRRFSKRSFEQHESFCSNHKVQPLISRTIKTIDKYPNSDWTSRSLPYSKSISYLKKRYPRSYKFIEDRAIKEQAKRQKPGVFPWKCWIIHGSTRNKKDLKIHLGDTLTSLTRLEGWGNYNSSNDKRSDITPARIICLPHSDQKSGEKSLPPPLELKNLRCLSCGSHRIRSSCHQKLCEETFSYLKNEVKNNKQDASSQTTLDQMVDQASCFSLDDDCNLSSYESIRLPLNNDFYPSQCSSPLHYIQATQDSKAQASINVLGEKNAEKLGRLHSHTQSVISNSNPELYSEKISVYSANSLSNSVSKLNHSTSISCDISQPYEVDYICNDTSISRNNRAVFSNKSISFTPDKTCSPHMQISSTSNDPKQKHLRYSNSNSIQPISGINFGPFIMSQASNHNRDVISSPKTHSPHEANELRLSSVGVNNIHDNFTTEYHTSETPSSTLPVNLNSPTEWLTCDDYVTPGMSSKLVSRIIGSAYMSNEILSKPSPIQESKSQTYITSPSRFSHMSHTMELSDNSSSEPTKLSIPEQPVLLNEFSPNNERNINNLGYQSRLNHVPRSHTVHVSCPKTYGVSTATQINSPSEIIIKTPHSSREQSPQGISCGMIESPTCMLIAGNPQVSSNDGDKHSAQSSVSAKAAHTQSELTPVSGISQSNYHLSYISESLPPGRDSQRRDSVASSMFRVPNLDPMVESESVPMNYNSINSLIPSPSSSLDSYPPSYLVSNPAGTATIATTASSNWLAPVSIGLSQCQLDAVNNNTERSYINTSHSLNTVFGSGTFDQNINRDHLNLCSISPMNCSHSPNSFSIFHEGNSPALNSAFSQPCDDIMVSDGKSNSPTDGAHVTPIATSIKSNNNLDTPKNSFTNQETDCLVLSNARQLYTSNSSAGLMHGKSNSESSSPAYGLPLPQESLHITQRTNKKTSELNFSPESSPKRSSHSISSISAKNNHDQPCEQFGEISYEKYSIKEDNYSLSKYREVEEHQDAVNSPLGRADLPIPKPAWFTVPSVDPEGTQADEYYQQKQLSLDPLLSVGWRVVTPEEQRDLEKEPSKSSHFPNYSSTVTPFNKHRPSDLKLVSDYSNSSDNFMSLQSPSSQGFSQNLGAQIFTPNGTNIATLSPRDQKFVQILKDCAEEQLSPRSKRNSVSSDLRDSPSNKWNILFASPQENNTGIMDIPFWGNLFLSDATWLDWLPFNFGAHSKPQKSVPTALPKSPVDKVEDTTLSEGSSKPIYVSPPPRLVSTTSHDPNPPYSQESQLPDIKPLKPPCDEFSFSPKISEQPDSYQNIDVPVNQHQKSQPEFKTILPIPSYEAKESNLFMPPRNIDEQIQTIKSPMFDIDKRYVSPYNKFYEQHESRSNCEMEKPKENSSASPQSSTRSHVMEIIKTFSPETCNFLSYVRFNSSASQPSRLKGDLVHPALPTTSDTSTNNDYTPQSSNSNLFNEFSHFQSINHTDGNNLQVESNSNFPYPNDNIYSPVPKLSCPQFSNSMISHNFHTYVSKPIQHVSSMSNCMAPVAESSEKFSAPILYKSDAIETCPSYVTTNIQHSDTHRSSYTSKLPSRELCLNQRGNYTIPESLSTSLASNSNAHHPINMYSQSFNNTQQSSYPSSFIMPSQSSNPASFRVPSASESLINKNPNHDVNLIPIDNPNSSCHQLSVDWEHIAPHCVRHQFYCPLEQNSSNKEGKMIYMGARPSPTLMIACNQFKNDQISEIPRFSLEPIHQREPQKAKYIPQIPNRMPKKFTNFSRTKKEKQRQSRWFCGE